MEVGDLLEAPSLLPMKGLFVTKFESKANCQLQKKSPQLWWLFSLWCFTQFGVLLSPISLKAVFPLLLDSNSSRDGTNPPFQLYGNSPTR